MAWRQLCRRVRVAGCIVSHLRRAYLAYTQNHTGPKSDADADGAPKVSISSLLHTAANDCAARAFVRRNATSRLGLPNVTARSRSSLQTCLARAVSGFGGRMSAPSAGSLSLPA